MMNVNLKQLEVFRAVVECQGFTDAARHLYLSQSTVSGHIAAMERELGVSLFIRNGKRKIVLTGEGKRIYAHACTILQSCEDLERELHEQTACELVLAASTIPGECLLPQYLSRFLPGFPGCQVTLLGGDSAEVHEMVLNGRAALGFAGTVLNRHELHYDLMCEDRLVLITPDTKKYRALLASGTDGNALLSEPLIFRENGSGTQRAVDKFLCENHVQTERIHPAARMSSHTSILRCVSMGFANAIVSELAARAASGILIFPLQGKSTTRHLYMIHAKGRHMSGAAREFYQYVRESSDVMSGNFQM